MFNGALWALKKKKQKDLQKTTAGLYARTAGKKSGLWDILREIIARIACFRFMWI